MLRIIIILAALMASATTSCTRIQVDAEGTITGVVDYKTVSVESEHCARIALKLAPEVNESLQRLDRESLDTARQWLQGRWFMASYQSVDVDGLCTDGIVLVSYAGSSQTMVVTPLENYLLTARYRHRTGASAN